MSTPAGPEAGTERTHTAAWRATVPDREGVRLGRRVLWSKEVVPDLRSDLVEYDLAAAAPVPGYEVAVVPNAEDVLRGYSPWDPWNGRLTAAILWTMGPAAWPAESTFLGWDPKRRRLLVHQTPGGLCHLEAVLDQFTATGRRATRIRIEVRAEDSDVPARHFVLDVPWDRRVEAYEGTEYTYLADYDIEVSMDTFVVGPLLAQHQCGCHVTAMRRFGRNDAHGDLDLQLVVSRDRPPFSLYEASLLGPDTRATIELTANPVAHWRGRLAASPGVRQHLVLGEGLTATITVVGDVGGVEQTRPAWHRIGAPGHAGPTPAQDEALHVRLVRRHDGEEVSGRIALADACRSGSVQLRSTPAEIRNFAPDGAEGLMHCQQDLRKALGGIQVEATRLGAVSERSAFDLVVSISRSTGVWREVLARWDIGHIGTSQQMRLRLPSIWRAVISRRLVLSPDGVGTVSFEADVGLGPEPFDLILERVWSR